MEQIRIQGGRRLEGKIRVRGSKNGVLPLLAASVMTGGTVIIENCPRLYDVHATIDILTYLGCGVEMDGETLTIDSSSMTGCEIPEELMNRLRSSVIFLGPLLARCGSAKISSPGGCELGARPIDLHIWGLSRLGARITETGGRLVCDTPSREGGEIVLSIPSVGATENLMLYAAVCSGKTKIFNAAAEPEIAELANFLNAAGYSVTGAGTPVIEILGTGRLVKSREVCHRAMPDRISAATWLCATAAAGGEIVVENALFRHLKPVAAILSEAGCEITHDESSVRIKRTGRLCAPREMVRTGPYPFFPTDAQPILMAPMAGAAGCTVFEENIFSDRFRHAGELNRMGGDIKIAGKYAVCTGVDSLRGEKVTSCDLRGGAALVIAGLGAKGVTTVSNVKYIDRGYYKIEEELSALGADVKRI